MNHLTLLAPPKYVEARARIRRLGYKIRSQAGMAEIAKRIAVHYLMAIPTQTADQVRIILWFLDQADGAKKQAPVAMLEFRPLVETRRMRDALERTREFMSLPRLRDD